MEYVGKQYLPNERVLTYEVLDSKHIKLLSNKTPTEQFINNKGYRKLQFEDLTIDLNTSISFLINEKKITYKVSNIRRVDSTYNYVLQTHHNTFTSQFLLPALGFNRDYFSFNQYLVNAYYVDSETMLLLYRFYPSDPYKELEFKLGNSPQNVKIQDVDGNFVLMEFKVPKQYKHDCEAFLEGKYSEFSETLKKQILKFHNYSTEGTTAKILYKDSALRNQLELHLGAIINEDLDLFDKPDLYAETFYPEIHTNIHLNGYTDILI